MNGAIEEEEGRGEMERVRKVDADFEYIRDEYIRKKMVEREHEFTKTKTINVFTGTWNVNGKQVDEDLTDWLKPSSQDHVSVDVYVIGFQEMVELNTQSVLLSHAFPGIDARSKQWQSKIRGVINRGIPGGGDDEYVLVKAGYLVGVMLCVFVNRRTMKNISEVAISYAGVGYGGFMGNKGGVAIRFCAYDSTFCFVCAHLAARRDKVKERNNDFANLSRKIVFEVFRERSAEGVENDSREAKDGTREDGGQYVNIPGHDVLVWLGDFNYRIDTSIPIEEVHRRCDRNDIDFLLSHDQLNLERKQGNAFEGFEEGAIDFLPSYKYQPKTNRYERRPDKKKRAPAWCDRVLWCAGRKEYVQQLKYGRAELLTSDHKPVYATFKMQAKQVVEAAKKTIMGQITHELDKWENEKMPQVELSDNQLKFGNVLFEERVVRRLVVRNVGKTNARFRFVPKLEERTFCKTWMNISPKFGMLTPGETETVDIAVLVDYRTARHMVSKRETIDDILVLRLDNGRDFFVSVSGQFAPTCFGMQLDDLTMRPDPIRPVVTDSNGSDETANDRQRLQIPKELWRLCDEIFSRGHLDVEGLFIKGGLPSEMKTIRRALDECSTFPSCSPHSTCAVLFEFLRSLGHPVLAPTLFASPEHDSVDATRMPKWCEDVLSRLKPLQYNVFVYLLLFFKEALAHSDKNGLHVDILIRIIAPRFTWGEREDLLHPRVIKRYHTQAGMFLKYLITQDFF